MFLIKTDGEELLSNCMRVCEAVSTLAFELG